MKQDKRVRYVYPKQPFWDEAEKTVTYKCLICGSKSTLSGSCGCRAVAHDDQAPEFLRDLCGAMNETVGAYDERDCEMLQKLGISGE